MIFKPKKTELIPSAEKAQFQTNADKLKEKAKNLVESAILGSDKKSKKGASKKNKLNTGFQSEDYGEYIPGQEKNQFSQSSI